jgi:hypothetical protein
MEMGYMDGWVDYMMEWRWSIWMDGLYDGMLESM